MAEDPILRDEEEASVLAPKLFITTALLWQPPESFQHTKRALLAESHVLDLHCDRILAAAEALSWQAVIKLFSGETGRGHFHAILHESIPDVIKISNLVSSTWKVRVLVSEDGSSQVLPAPVSLSLVSGIPQWPLLPKKLHQIPLGSEVSRVFVDRQPTVASILTTHKTTYRSHYDDARSRCNIEHHGPMQSEVLLFNEDQEVMEASLCTPYFLRDGVWMTPTLSSGGNAGVSRRMALEGGLCVEKIFHVGELCDGERIWLSNAVRGFMQGRMDLSVRS
jgi:4-amino-4-deoxychorismate lyase